MKKEEYLHASPLKVPGVLTDAAMVCQDAYRMIAKKGDCAGHPSKIGCHPFRATGLTHNLTKRRASRKSRNRWANHERSRPLGLYDRRNDRSADARQGRTDPHIDAAHQKHERSHW